MSELCIGVIGLGLGRHHVAAYAQEKAVQRLVVCDPDARRLADVQASTPRVAAGYRSLQAMLESERLDAVSVVTPDHLHRPHAEACLEAGCHVLLTKPLATNLEDGRAIVRKAETAERKLMVAHERRFRKHVIEIVRLLEAGLLGEIIHLRIDAMQDKRRQFEQSPWYASAEAGRTALVGSGIHEVDLVRYLIGQPIRQAFAVSNRLGTLAFPKDKTTAALYQFQGGAIGQVTVTYEAHRKPGGPRDTDFHLVGSRGVIVGSRVTCDGRQGWTELPQDDRAIVTGTFGCVNAFVASIVEGRAIPVDGREAFASLAACVAADQSAATGEPVVPAQADFR
jgi:predicted dehydrogenase